MEFTNLIERTFKTNNKYALFFISLLIAEALTTIEYFICPCLLGQEACDVKYFEEKEILFTIFMVAVIVAPLIETFLLQYAIIEIGKYFFKQNQLKTDLLFLFISASLFGIGHNYNILTIVHAFFFGLIFASVYIYQREKKNRPFFFTFLLHALSNFIAFIVDDAFHLVK